MIMGIILNFVRCSIGNRQVSADSTVQRENNHSVAKVRTRGFRQLVGRGGDGSAESWNKPAQLKRRAAFDLIKIRRRIGNGYQSATGIPVAETVENADRRFRFTHARAGAPHLNLFLQETSQVHPRARGSATHKFVGKVEAIGSPTRARERRSKTAKIWQFPRFTHARAGAP